MARALPIIDDVVDAAVTDVDTPVPHASAPEGPDPARLADAWFRVRALRHGVVRLAENARGGIARAARATDDDIAQLARVAASSSSPLWTDADPKERALVAGKIENLRRACARLDGAVVRAGEVFSFWAEVGPPWARFGFVDGREPREGCLVPSVGGGLCQVSNALYACALDAAGLVDVVERHAHSARLVGSAAETERDATVFWPYVDLRFLARVDVRLSARLTRDRLEVDLYAPAVVAASTSPTASAASAASSARTSTTTTVNPLAHRGASASAASARPTIIVDDHACDTCGHGDCSVGDHARARIDKAARSRTRAGATAFVVDEHGPELAALIARERTPGDVIALPLPGALLHMPQYAWDTRGFDVVAAPLVALRRSRAMRALTTEGARRVQAQLAFADALARVYARSLGPRVEKLLVAQPLLPALASAGALGGRSVDVFLTRLPLFLLHARLDHAASAHPESALLRAYRAEQRVVDAERAALFAADRLITAHADIARELVAAGISAQRVVLVPWAPPSTSLRARVGGKRVVFLGPVAARKGAHAVREAAQRLGLTVVLVGSELEGATFFGGVDVERTTWARAFMHHVRAVVQPALVEDRPRRLLEALTAGVPVVATAACGLRAQRGLTEVAFDDVDALVRALDTRQPIQHARDQSGHVVLGDVHSTVPLPGMRQRF